MAASPDGKFLYVADSLDDTISVVATATGQRPATIELGPRPEPTAADRGERLYYSAKLSHDGWMSCHSCHTDGHTNGLLSDTLGDGSYGAAKRVPSLLGVAATGPWTWTGSMARLEDQVRKSIATTMHGPKPTDAQVADLTAYLNTLAPPSPRLWDTGRDKTAVERGRAVFQSRKCDACHVPPEYTSPARYDVGLADEVGNHEFNPPSLRGVSRRDALLPRRPRPIARRGLSEGAASPGPRADAPGDRRPHRVPRDALMFGWQRRVVRQQVDRRQCRFPRNPNRKSTMRSGRRARSR